MDKLASEHAETIRRIAAELKGRPGPLIEVLHASQAEVGHVSAAAVPLVHTIATGSPVARFHRIVVSR